MNGKKYYLLILVTVLITMAFMMIAATNATWQRSCSGSVTAEKTAGEWMITCKMGGSGIKIVMGGGTVDPSPWPRDATTEALYSATWTPEPQPTFDPYLPPVVYP